MFLTIIPVILAFLLLGAHFLRSDDTILMVVSVLAPCLLLIKQRWSLLITQWLAYCGALVWIHTTFLLVRQRIAIGAQWGRMLLILSAIALFTLWAGYLLNSDVVRQRYR
jgi:hypothetical protein